MRIPATVCVSAGGAGGFSVLASAKPFVWGWSQDMHAVTPMLQAAQLVSGRFMKSSRLPSFILSLQENIRIHVMVPTP